MNIETLNGKKIDCADVSRISYRDLYFRFWSCRDFEIAHVWNRAIFLTAFLIACFAGYGTVLLAMVKPAECCVRSEIVNALAFCLTLIGIVVSVLWIMMAKGSKKWYERWENAIEAFRKSPKYRDAFEGKVDEIAGMKHSDIEGFKEFGDPDASDCIFNTDGGNYSVSRINVFIGQFSLLVWLVLMVYHLICAFAIAFWERKIELIPSRWIPWVLIIVAGLLFFWFYRCAAPGLKGGGKNLCMLPLVRWLYCVCVRKTTKMK